MKVSELIRILLRMPQDLPVKASDKYNPATGWSGASVKLKEDAVYISGGYPMYGYDDDHP